MDAVISTIGTCQDHSGIATWENSVCQSMDLFHVAVIYDGIEDIQRHLQASHNLLKYTPFDFLLITDTGDKIAWKVHENLAIAPLDFVLIRKEPYLEESSLYSAVENFLKQYFPDPVIINKEIYHHNDDFRTFQETLRTILPDLSQINDELIAFLVVHPEYLQELHWRKYEKLLDALFKNMGYDTELGPGRADGGVDIRLIHRTDIGKFLILVQAKRYASKYPIGLQPVQALYGAVSAEDASKGILASTSGFEPAAKIFAKNHSSRIELAGPDEIQQWLRNYANK